MDISVLDAQQTIKDVEKRLKNYQKRAIPAATRYALNNTIRGTKSFIAKRLKKEVGLKSASVKSRTIIENFAQLNALRAVIRIKRVAPNIGSFGRLKKLKTAISGIAWKKRRQFKDSFILNVGKKKGGAAQILIHRVKGTSVTKQITYKRKKKYGTRYTTTSTAKRQKIAPTYGPSLREQFTNKKSDAVILAPIRKFAEERFNKVFEQKLNWQLQR